jgi:hypothetical protein
MKGVCIDSENAALKHLWQVGLLILECVKTLNKGGTTGT